MLALLQLAVIVSLIAPGGGLIIGPVEGSVEIPQGGLYGVSYDGVTAGTIYLESGRYLVEERLRYPEAGDAAWLIIVLRSSDDVNVSYSLETSGPLVKARVEIRFKASGSAPCPAKLESYRGDSNVSDLVSLKMRSGVFEGTCTVTLDLGGSLASVLSPSPRSWLTIFAGTLNQSAAVIIGKVGKAGGLTGGPGSPTQTASGGFFTIAEGDRLGEGFRGAVYPAGYRYWEIILLAASILLALVSEVGLARKGGRVS